MKHVTAILLAGGRGSRIRSAVSKPLIKINSQPLIGFSLRTLQAHPQIKDIIVVVNARNKIGIAGVIEKSRLTKVIHFVEGGKRRQDSVYNALRFLPEAADLVLIHDAARPFVSAKVVVSAIRIANRYGAAIVGVPVKATIKKVRGKGVSDKGYVVKKTLDRNNLWEIQTPQVFKKEIIVKAYAKFIDLTVTDDAALVEKLGKRIHVVEGEYSNIKVTTPEDLVLAEAIARKAISCKP